MEIIMVRFTTKALEEQLKAARKELRAAKRKSLLQAFFTGLMFFQTNKKKPYNAYLLIRHHDLKVYNLEKTLQARKNAIQTYHRYKKGQSERNHALFAYVKYRYFKDKLIKQR